MTPQEKAQQIKESFNNSLTAKECSLIAIDEIIEALSFHSWQNRNELMFFLEVKMILQNL